MQANTDHRAGLSPIVVVLVVAVLLVAAVGGLMLGKLMASPKPEATEKEAATTEEVEEAEEYVFLPFDMTVVNLAEARLTRYLSVSLSLQVERESSNVVRQVFESDRKAVFKNWLISYLSDKKLEEVKGSASLNELRREILDGFNTILAEHSDKRINAVLFEEFNVQ